MGSLFPQRDDPQGLSQGGALLLDVRPQVLLDENHLGEPARSSGVRDDAEEHGVDIEAAIPEGMREKAKEFVEAGGEIYQEV